ncbi:unnamed protein product [Polarella glacialis]|uniref:Peptide-O-fucosyltransferase n=1 Tax=Polarella glacialis TaxID=89957 RepID=A0A813F813_POLGL|nr:unnamed protein product [Polarella glacialis]
MVQVHGASAEAFGEPRPLAQELVNEKNNNIVVVVVVGDAAATTTAEAAMTTTAEEAVPQVPLTLPDKSLPVRKLYYERDLAGFSNVRLQFESMVAITAAFRRELVIAPPTPLAHVENATFQEFDAYSKDALGKVIQFSMGQEQSCPPHALKLKSNLAIADLWRDLDQDQDWCFGMWESRVQHFECLPHMSDGDYARMAWAVFNGLQFNQNVIEDSRRALQLMGLQPGHYIAAHIRRGDFQNVEPQVVRSGVEFDQVLNEYVKGMPLLVITDALPGDQLFQEITAHSKATHVVFPSTELPRPANTLHDALMDVLFAAQASDFFGTPASTFANTISLLRTKIGICLERSRHDMEPSFLQFSSVKTAEVEGGRSASGARFVQRQYWFKSNITYDQPNNFSATGGQCWGSVTNFIHLPPENSSAPLECPLLVK